MTVDSVHFVEYDPSWPQRYQAARKELLRAFGDEVVAIEHFGSTSVPGLSSKDLIDILIAVPKLAPVDHYIALLADLDYVYVDEVSPPERKVFRRGMPRTHHLHIVEADSDAWERPILFRDYMRAHPEAREAYEHLKIQNAEIFGDNRDAYTASKTDFVNEICDKAREERDK